MKLINLNKLNKNQPYHLFHNHLFFPVVSPKQVKKKNQV